MKALLGFAGFCALLVGAAALVAYTGVYDVSVSSGHSAPLEKTLGWVTRQSIRAHARDITRPTETDIRSPERLEKAAGQYEAMCRTCHAAPGRKADPWLLYPPAPDLVETLPTRTWSDTEVFWIIKHGIKDTAMSAFGGAHAGAHTDEELWALTALLRQFATMVPEQYRTMTARAQARPDAHGGHLPAGSENEHSAPEPGRARPPKPDEPHLP